MGIFSFFTKIPDLVRPSADEDFGNLNVVLLKDLSICEDVLHEVYDIALQGLEVSSSAAFSHADLGNHYANVLKEICARIEKYPQLDNVKWVHSVLEQLEDGQESNNSTT